MQLQLEVTPRAKERPRLNPRSGKFYTPNSTKEYEELLRTRMQAQLGNGWRPMDGLVRVKLWLAADYVLLDVSGVERNQLPVLRGDIDNYAKSILDAANGLVWQDDSRVVALEAIKW